MVVQTTEWQFALLQIAIYYTHIIHMILCINYIQFLFPSSLEICPTCFLLNMWFPDNIRRLKCDERRHSIRIASGDEHFDSSVTQALAVQKYLD